MKTPQPEDFGTGTKAGPLSAALDYAARGWPVLPLVHCAKRPLTRRGVSDARTDERALCAWWEQWPTAGVGIATGERSGLVVLDVDPRNGGGTSLRRLQHEHGGLPSTATVCTGGGGAHVYLRAAGQVRSRVPLPGYAGLDLKADGGYVAAPPSIHASGRRYEWHRRERIAEAPAWLVALAIREARPSTTPFPAGALSATDLADALQRHPRVRARFERGSRGLRDTSPSGVDLGLASGLALLGFDHEAIASAIAESRARAGLPAKRPGYLRSTVQLALGTRR